jgi:hypothetical protein
VVSLDSTRLQQLTSDARPKRATPIWLPTLMR